MLWYMFHFSLTHYFNYFDTSICFLSEIYTSICFLQVTTLFMHMWIVLFDRPQTQINKLILYTRHRKRQVSQFYILSGTHNFFNVLIEILVNGLQEGPIDGNLGHGRLRITVPRPPDLATAQRALRIRFSLHLAIVFS